MNKRFLPGTGFLLLLFLWSVPAAQAQTEIPLLGYTHGVGVRAIGMGGAFVGLANDYAATYWNPAGLGQIRRMELTGSLSSLSYQDESTFYGSNSVDKASATQLHAVGFVFPIPTYRGSLVFSLGYNRVASFNGNFLVDGFNSSPGDSVRQVGEQIDRGGLRQWVFAGSVQMSENLYLGGSLNLWTGNYNYSWEMREIDELDIWEQSQWLYQDEIDTKINGFNMTFGALYNLYNRFRFGATIETPLSFKGAEDWNSYTKIDYDDNTYWDSTSTGTYDYHIRKPMTINLGASLSLPLLTVAGDVSFIDWSQMEYTSPSDLRTQNRYFIKKMRPVTRYRLGAEMAVPLLNVRLRAGYMLDPSPYKNDLSSADKNFLTAGFGLLLDRQFTLDAAAVRGWWKRRSSENLLETITVTQFFVSGSFRF